VPVRDEGADHHRQARAAICAPCASCTGPQDFGGPKFLCRPIYLYIKKSNQGKLPELCHFGSSLDVDARTPTRVDMRLFVNRA
jgi:hypothetical protein